MIAIYCRKCGKPLPDDAAFCVHCGAKVVSTRPQETAKPSGGADLHSRADALRSACARSEPLQKAQVFLRRKWPVVLLAAILLLIVIAGTAVYWNNTRCAYSGCSNKAEYGRYCARHVCLAAGCTNPRTAGSSYCYAHQAPTYSAIVDLDIGPVDLSTNSSYTIATGTVTNNGSHTYTFVKVKGTFEDSSGTVVDTDWTYVVGSEGLAPGETKSYRLSVPKDYTIRSCTVSILDYD